MNETKEKNVLPDGWRVVRLGDYAKTEKGKKPKIVSTEKTIQCPIPYINIKAFERNIIDEYTDGKGCVICEDDDFLMVWDGSRSGYVGKAITGALGSTLVKIKLPDVNHDFAYYFLQSKYVEINTRAKGVGIPHVDPNIVWNYQFPLPPKSAQQAIVSKIEELFSELDKAIETLRLAQQQLKTYRQAVLKCAFEGKLTEEWRKENRTSVRVPAGSQKSKVVPTGIEPKLIAAEPVIDYKITNKNNEGSELPEDWKWLTIGDTFEVFIGSTPKRNVSDYWNGNINWVSSGEIAFCNIIETREKITEEGLKNTSCKVHPIGTVIIAMIGEGKTRGQAAILKIEASHNQNTAAIRVDKNVYKSQLLYYYLVLKYEDNRRVGSGNNQKALNKERVKSIPVPIIPIIEQEQIIDEIESRLSVADKMEESIIQSLQQAEALRQSILKKAFEGRLT